jgi:hypothetical protein
MSKLKNKNKKPCTEFFVAVPKRNSIIIKKIMRSPLITILSGRHIVQPFPHCLYVCLKTDLSRKIIMITSPLFAANKIFKLIFITLSIRSTTGKKIGNTDGPNNECDFNIKIGWIPMIDIKLASNVLCRKRLLKAKKNSKNSKNAVENYNFLAGWIGVQCGPISSRQEMPEELGWLWIV